MTVRFARREDLPSVNVLRRQVNDLHAAGKPEVFKSGFPDELQEYVYAFFDDPDKKILVAEQDGGICGFAMLQEVHRPENPYMLERNHLDIDEFCVAEASRRQGVGRALIAFLCAYAKERGFDRVELNMWEFNKDALAFYEAVGFSTYRRFLEMKL